MRQLNHEISADSPRIPAKHDNPVCQKHCLLDVVGNNKDCTCRYLFVEPQLKEQLIARMISQKRPEFDNTKDVIDEALDSSINNAFVLGVCVGTSVCYYVATIIRYHLNGFSINLQGMVVMAVKAFPNGGFQSETVTYLNGFPILVVLLFVSVKCVTIIFPYFKKRERYYSVVIVPVTFIFLIGIGFW